MSLAKQIISLPMALGIDTENSPPLIDNQRFSNLSNVVFNKDSKGELHKRSGHTALPTAVQGGGMLPPAQLISVFNDETDVIAGNGLYGYSPTSQNWTPRGQLPIVQQVETNIAAGAFSVSNPDACSLNGLAFYVYEMNGSSWIKVVDDSNKSTKLTAQLKSSSGLLYSPKVLANFSSVLIIATDTSGIIWFVTIDATTLSITYHSTTFPLDVVAGSNETCFDAAILGAAIYIAGIGSSALKGITYSSIGPSYTFIATPAGGNIASPVIAPSPVSVSRVGNFIYVTYQSPQPANGGNGFVEFQQYTSSAWAAGPSGGVSPTAVAPCPRITSGGVVIEGVPYYVSFYETDPAGSNTLSSITYYSPGGGVILWSTGTSIVGQPFYIGANLYLPVVYTSEVQQTMFLTFQETSLTPANSLAQVAGRYLSSNNAGAAPSNFRIPAPFNLTLTSASLPVMVQPQGSSAATVSASLAELSLDFGSVVSSSPYLLPDDSNALVHVNGTDLNAGTAKVGPAWGASAPIPYVSTNNPTPSVGPFVGSNMFILPPGGPLALAPSQSFTVSVVLSIPAIFQNYPFADVAGVIIDNGLGPPTDDPNQFWLEIATDGPVNAFVSFGMSTSTLFHTLDILLPYADLIGGQVTVTPGLGQVGIPPGPLVVISMGYDGSTNNMFMKINGLATQTTNLGGPSATTTTPCFLGNWYWGGGYDATNGQIHELLVSKDTPSDGLFTGIYNNVQSKLTDAVDAQFAQLGGNMHIACGSQLMDYDGENLFEHNFHIYPETPTVSYLSSQITVITDGYDPNYAAAGLPQGVYRIMIPDNAGNPGGPIGQLITPGEYITFYPDAINPSSPGYIIYFTVNGIGSPPSGVGLIASTTSCPLTSSMTATQVAQTLVATMNAVTNLNVVYTISYTPAAQTNTATPQTINLSNQGVSGVAAAPPVMSTFGNATQVYYGTMSADACVGLSFPPGANISTGQYVSFTSTSTFFGSIVNQKAVIYIWFSNPNNPTIGNETKSGGDPKPFGTLPNGPTVIGVGTTASCTWSNNTGPGNYIGAEVVLTGTETPVAVATLVAQAINAIRSSTTPNFNLGFTTFTATQQSNTVSVQYGLTTSVGQIGPADAPSTTVGRGYVGAVIDNSSQPYAAIQYSSVYEDVDIQNQLHQSAPSIPAIAFIPTYIATGTGTNNNAIQPLSAVPVSAIVQVATNPISLTLRTSALTGTDLDIAIYRTISGATVGNQVFYRITPSNQLLFNEPSSTAPIIYADYSSDGVGINSLEVGQQASGIQSNQTLYTTGGVQPNSAPPACSYVINHQNRLWLAGLENPNELWYSETLDSGFGVAFTQEQIALINPTVGQTVGGALVALASMDSNLIILQENQIWFIQGSGPDPTGGNGFFAPPQIVASSSKIGCRDVNSVVLQPQGVMFKSTQGFWLLGRDLSLKYVGAPVKTFNSDVVSSAVALANNSQINFLSTSGTTLMYDWYYDSWSTFSTNGSDSVIDINGAFNMITSSGAIWVQTPGIYIDGDGSPVIMSINTAWLKPGNVQGFQRIWKAFFEGQFYGSQPYLVQIAYNYNATVVDNFTLNAGSGSSSIGTWGGSATWGATIWGEDGGTATVYADQIQIRVYPSNQLCESIQFTVTDQVPVPSSQTWSLNALDLELGVRRGGMKRIGNPQSLG